MKGYALAILRFLQSWATTKSSPFGGILNQTDFNHHYATCGREQKGEKHGKAA